MFVSSCGDRDTAGASLLCRKLRSGRSVCSVIPASLQANGVVFPLAIAASICRRMFTICAGAWFLHRAIYGSFYTSLSHSRWYKICRALYGEVYLIATMRLYFATTLSASCTTAFLTQIAPPLQLYFGISEQEVSGLMDDLEKPYGLLHRPTHCNRFAVEADAAERRVGFPSSVFLSGHSRNHHFGEKWGP